MEVENYRYFFFDLDKTIWNWNELIIGAADLIDSLREADKQVFFHTDNTLLTREGYARKLTEMGIPAEEENIITSGYVAADYLVKNNITKSYVIGNHGVMDEIDNRGIEISEDSNIVVSAFDQAFNYEKASKAMKIMEEGGQVLTCGKEKKFRTSESKKPNQGPFNRLIGMFGDSKNMGKPDQVFRDAFKEYFNYFPGKSVFIGDRLEDIQTGNKLGMTTVSVMSGVVDRKTLGKAEDDREPDYGLSSLNKLKRRII